MEARARRLAPITRERSRTLRRNPTDTERKLWSALRRKALAGAQHAQAQEYDHRRTKFLESLGFRVLRFWNNDVLTNLEGVLETILQHLPPS